MKMFVKFGTQMHEAELPDDAPTVDLAPHAPGMCPMCPREVGHIDYENRRIQCVIGHAFDMPVRTLTIDHESKVAIVKDLDVEVSRHSFTPCLFDTDQVSG